MKLFFRYVYLPFVVLAVLPINASSQQIGTLKMSVYPKEAYTFVDGNAIGPGNRRIHLPYGSHQVIVANYGYKFYEKEVTVDSPRASVLKVTLDPIGEEVSGPRGRIQIELGELGTFTDAGADAVLLNGKTVNYFVGHVDEFNHDIHWHQELIVPPGTHEVTVTRNGKQTWSGNLTVGANQRVIVNIANGKQKTKDWPRGTQLGALPRFTARTASATVVIAPVSGTISATPAKIDCGQASTVKWAAKDAVDADVSHMSPVPMVGERSVSPKQTTTYDFTAKGPGGSASSSTTLEVNPTVQASLNATPSEVRYRRIGDKTLETSDVTVNWSSSNADTASVTPFGSVEPNGNKVVTVTPSQSSNGAVDETTSYALTASNACGGTETKTVSVHITGSIEPIPEVLLNSVFFPTDYPVEKDPSLGLLRSQQEDLTNVATSFKKYLEYDPDAKLSLSAYTDDRGSDKHNQPLSDRRAERVKEFLVSQGVPEGKIESSSFGKEKPLDKEAVAALQSQNPSQPSETKAKNAKVIWLAYNRRVDIVLLPKNQESLRYYPNGAPDSGVLSQLTKPSTKTVTENQ
jgi:outer membrane protein OmpA-like peptidoglycan-associated protein